MPSSQPVSSGAQNRAAILVHGFGTSVDDVIPLAQAFAARGFHCEAIVLKGHDAGHVGLEEATPEAWLRQIEEAVARNEAASRTTVLVGFSIGAALCIEVAERRNVAAVLAISTFLGRRWPRLTRLVLTTLARLGRKHFGRKPHTTCPATLAQLKYSPQLPVAASARVVDFGNSLARRLLRSDTKILLVHSLQDKVADYAPVGRFAGRNNATCRLVTLRALNHFLQFDVAPARLRDVFLKYIDDETPTAQEPHGTLPEMISQMHQEHRHWSGILFNLVWGFFTVFGILVYNTLPDILEGSEKAPYYLVAYSLSLSAYSIIGVLYTFYLERTIFDLKVYLEPLIPLVSSNTHRLNIHAGGSASRRITPIVSTVFLLIPLLASAASTVALFVNFGGLLQDFSKPNILLQATAAVSVGLVLGAAWLTLKLFRYTRELHMVPRPRWTNTEIEQAIVALLLAVDPGSVSSSGTQAGVTIVK